MSRDYSLYLWDILKAIDKIKRYIQDIPDEPTFEANEQIVDSVLFNLITIGEAAKNIPDEIREQSPEVGWSEIGRFRDYVVHHYFSLKLNRVWSITQNNLGVLRSQVEMLLKRLDEELNKPQ